MPSWSPTGLLTIGLYLAALPALAKAGDALDFYLHRLRLESLRLRNGFSAGKGPMGDSVRGLIRAHYCA